MMLRLSFNPFIAKQLCETKIFSRNPEYFKIKNSIAFKFLVCMCCDKKLLNGVSVLKTAIQELNGVEINNTIQSYKYN
jgi:hypothetical protein